MTSRPYKIGDHPSWQRAFPAMREMAKFYESFNAYRDQRTSDDGRIADTVAHHLRSRTGDRLGARGER